jgi:hypothetical protein
VINYIMADKVWYTNGMARYSDLSMIILGMIVEHITHVPLEVFAAKEIFEPASLPFCDFKIRSYDITSWLYSNFKLFEEGVRTQFKVVKNIYCIPEFPIIALFVMFIIVAV